MEMRAQIASGPRRRHRGRVLLLLLACLPFAGPFSGCSYSFTGTNLPSHIKTIAVPNFENETLEPSLAQDATTGVLDRFIKDGRLKIAPESQAGARLIVRVLKYENKVRNYDAAQNPKDYVVVLTVAATLRDQVKNRDLWKDDAITRTAVYVPNGPSGTLTTEQAARAQAISDLADDLVSRTLEQW